METAVDYTDGTAYFSSDERRWINRIRKLKEMYPDAVTIKVQPEINDGCICATFPAEWFQIRPPVKQNLTEEQRQARSDAFKARFHKGEPG